MLGLIARKKDYYYTAKWISNDDRKKYGYFKFKIVSDDNLYKADVDNMSGYKGQGVWETKSSLDFQPDDIVLFRGDRFNIVNVDGNKKAENQEQAYYFFRYNCNTVTTLQVRKAGMR